MFSRALLLAVLLAASLFNIAPASAQTAPAQTIWRLLDYIAVDYREAVKDGQVVNPGEYQEMTEFSRSARERIALLPVTSAKLGLQQEAAALEQMIAG